MNQRDAAELAAVPAILQYLIAERRPSSSDTKDPAWRDIFEDAYYFAARFGAVYARSKPD